MGPVWAEVYDSAHVGHKWVQCGLMNLVHWYKGHIWVHYGRKYMTTPISDTSGSNVG